MALDFSAFGFEEEEDKKKKSNLDFSAFDIQEKPTIETASPVETRRATQLSKFGIKEPEGTKAKFTAPPTLGGRGLGFSFTPLSQAPITEASQALARDISDEAKARIRGGSWIDTLKEVDHIAPVSLGGTRDDYNLQALSSPYGRGLSEKEIKTRQEGKMAVEWDNIEKFNRGELTQGQAIYNILQYQWATPEQRKKMEQGIDVKLAFENIDIKQAEKSFDDAIQKNSNSSAVKMAWNDLLDFGKKASGETLKAIVGIFSGDDFGYSSLETKTDKQKEEKKKEEERKYLEGTTANVIADYYKKLDWEERARRGYETNPRLLTEDEKRKMDELISIYTKENLAEREKRNNAIWARAKTLPEDYVEPGAGGQFWDAIQQSSLQVISSIGSALEGYGVRIDNQALKKLGAETADEFKAKLAERPELAAPVYEDKWKNKDYYARLFGEAIPSIAGAIAITGGTAVLTGGNIPAGLAAGFTYAYTLEGGNAYQEAIDMGLNEQEAVKIQEQVGMINGLLEMMPIERLFNRTPAGKQLKNNLLRRISNQIIKQTKQGQFEGTTEAMQEIVNNAIFMELDENRGLYDNVLESYAGGVLGGIGAGTVAEVTEQVSKKTQSKIEDKKIENTIQKVGEENKYSQEVINGLIESYKQAPKLKENIDNIADNIASKYDGLTVIKSPLKGILADKTFNPKRALEKYDSSGQIKDVARNTILVDNVSAIPQIMKDLQDAGVVIPFGKDYFAIPSYLGYRGVNGVLFEGKEGGEMQLQVPEIMYYKEAMKDGSAIFENPIFEEIKKSAEEAGLENGRGHKIYEDIRGYEAKAKKEGRRFFDENGKEYFDWTPEEQKVVLPLIEESNKGYTLALDLAERRTSLYRSSEISTPDSIKSAMDIPGSTVTRKLPLSKGTKEATLPSSSKKVGLSKDIKSPFVKGVKSPSKPIISKKGEKVKLDKSDEIINTKLYEQTKDTNKPSKSKISPKRKGFQETKQGGTIKNLPKDIESNVPELTKFINNNPDGFTISVDGKVPSSGFVVSPYKQFEKVLDNVTEETVRDFLLDNYEILIKDNHYFGGWKNNKDGKFYLDVSILENDINKAIDIAVKNDQIAIYDISKGEEINTQDFLKKKVVIKPKKTEEAFSTHYEKIKDEFGFEGEIEIDRVTNKEQARLAFNYIQRNPEGAMRIAYGFQQHPNAQAIRQSLVVSLKEAGKLAQAQEIAKIVSKEFTKAAQTLNLAKADLGADRQITRNITDARLKKLGEALGAKPEKAIEQATRKVKQETTKARNKVADSQVKISKESIKQFDALIDSIIC